MEWVKDFYNKQLIWSKTKIDYDMEELVNDLVDKVEQFSNISPPGKILELGGGNGQFAVSAAKKGFEVTVIEFAPAAVEHTNQLSNKYNVGNNLRVIEGDFYEVDLNEQFDVICYWDGFGVGSDLDQQTLLKRISNWLKPGGTGLIDIYTPWYWSNAAGEEMSFGKISRKYDFDANKCRMLDTWWISEDKSDKITQSLRCYSPADLRLLINDIDLTLDHCEPGGAMDYEKWHYSEQVPLNNAMSFLAMFSKG